MQTQWTVWMCRRQRGSLLWFRICVSDATAGRVARWRSVCCRWRHGIKGIPIGNECPPPYTLGYGRFSMSNILSLNAVFLRCEYQTNKIVLSKDTVGGGGKWGNGSMCRTFYKIGFLEHLKIQLFSRTYINRILYFLRLFKNIKKAEERHSHR